MLPLLGARPALVPVAATPGGQALPVVAGALPDRAGADERSAERVARLHRRRRRSAWSRRPARRRVLDDAAPHPAVAARRALALQAAARARRCWSALGARGVALLGAPTRRRIRRRRPTTSSTATARRSSSWRSGASQYDLLLLTANRVNQPQIFAAFYNAERPGGAAERARARLPDHRSGRVRPLRDEPAHPRGAARGRPAAVRRLHRAAPRAAAERRRSSTSSPTSAHRKRFLREWLLLGPFDNPAAPASAAATSTPADVAAARDTRARAGRPTGGACCRSSCASTSTRFYGHTRRRRPASRSSGCAATPTRRSTCRRRSHAMLELGAGNQPVQAWVNGSPLTERMMPVPPAPAALADPAPAPAPTRCC